MSVDCTAKIVYGWLMTNDEIYDFKEKDGENYDACEYLQCINAYSRDTDYVYGIEITRTDYVQFIEPDMIDSEVWDNDEDWVKCWHQFKRDFPNKINNVKPGFFLVCNWW